MTVRRVLISQPSEWIEAFRQQATRNSESLSEFLGACARENLDPDLLETLGERPGRGPKKKEQSDAPN
jgi:hypothetical protein